jgi:hypothetical protein
LLILEMPKGAISKETLTFCQQDARSGLYSEAMGGFIGWLAGQYDEARSNLDRQIAQHRISALRKIAHARTPDIVANLQAAFDLYLEFGLASNAITAAEKDNLSRRSWEALRCAAAAQAKHQAATEPTTRFLDLIRSALTSGRAHLRSREGGQPEFEPGSCGWRRDALSTWAPFGECVGWVDADNVYLEPTAAYRLAQTAARDMGEALVLSEQTLKKRLHEKGLLASVDGTRQTLTVRKSIGGCSRSVLHFLRITILPEDQDNDAAEEE